nr:GIY-YIG endonuclease [Monilinia fructicola]QRF72265.1 GIY-YIG endonuclease [Monilinia fructicola]
MIYRSLIKNGYSNFKLEILEYCEIDVVIEREQYYLDRFKPEYNILKVAGSLRGFKHSEATKEAMSLSKKDSIISEETRLKIATTLSKGEYIVVKVLETDSFLSFISIRKAAEFIDIHPSYLAKTIKLSGFYKSKEFLVYKSSTPLEEILKLETYKNAITNEDRTKKRTETSKELIRKANLGKTLSPETIAKITLNSKNAKPVLVTNIETKEIIEFSSASAAAKYLGVDESYVRRCITNNKSCKGHIVQR